MENERENEKTESAAESGAALSECGTAGAAYAGAPRLGAKKRVLLSVAHFFKSSVVLIVALVAAAVSILTKEALYQYTCFVGRKVKSQVVIANAWHHRSDAFSSVGTMLGIGGAIFLGDSWRILDPLAAVVVSIFIVKIGLIQTTTALNDLLDKSLPKEVEDEILSLLTEDPLVSSPHNLYTRHIGNDVSIEAHIRMDGHLSLEEAHAVTRQIEQRLRLRFGPNTHIMLHVEPTK